MSWQAMDAIDRIPFDACKPLEFRVLAKLANVAAQDGSRAFRSAAEMARELDVSVRSIQRALKALEGDRIILRGDQRHVQHLRADRRPIVYDVNMPKCLDWEAYHAPVPLTIDDTTHDTTRLSTGGDENPGITGLDDTTRLSTESHDTTHDTTAAVAHKELIELTTTSSRGNQTAPVVSRGECGHEHLEGRCVVACRADFERREQLAGAAS